MLAPYYLIYVIVIPYPRGLYGIYCLRPRDPPSGSGNKSHAARGGFGITILKPTIVRRALPSDSLTSLIIAMLTMSAPWLPFDVIAVYVLASLASARREFSE